jgi:hypothetical protein
MDPDTSDEDEELNNPVPAPLPRTPVAGVSNTHSGASKAPPKTHTSAVAVAKGPPKGAGKADVTKSVVIARKTSKKSAVQVANKRQVSEPISKKKQFQGHPAKRMKAATTSNSHNGSTGHSSAPPEGSSSESDGDDSDSDGSIDSDERSGDTSSEEDDSSSSGAEDGQLHDRSNGREPRQSAGHTEATPIVTGRIVCVPDAASSVARLEREFLEKPTASEGAPAEIREALQLARERFGSSETKRAFELVRSSSTVDNASYMAVLGASVDSLTNISSAVSTLRTEQMAASELKASLSVAKATSKKLLDVWDSLIPELEDIKKDAQQVLDATAHLSTRLVRLHATHVGIMEGVANLIQSNGRS